MFQKLLSAVLLLAACFAGPTSVAAEPTHSGHAARALDVGHGGHRIPNRAWQRSSSADCRHCAALDCAGVTHCTSSTVGVMPLPVGGAAPLLPQPPVGVRCRHALTSVLPQPPTPPPQRPA